MMASDHGPTKLLYQHHGDLQQFVATVTGIEKLDNTEQQKNANADQETHVVYLDETIFHVQGGGQPFDLGEISSTNTSDPTIFRVSGVRHGDTEAVRHLGSFLRADSEPFKPEDRVKLTIDADRRLLNSRIHTAGHILGLAVRGLSRKGKLSELTELKAQHYPDAAFVEFRGTIDGKHKEMIQAATDDLVKKALPVKVCFWNREECNANEITLPEKVEGEGDKLYRTVLIENYGAYPCGGTHVLDTAGVGQITVRNIKRQKGVSKVSYAVS